MSGTTADFRQGTFRTEGLVLSTDEFVRELDAIIDHPSRDRRNHPFVKAVEAGTATLDQIAGWRHPVTLWAHPANNLFGTMWSRYPDPDLADMIFENLSEEEHGTPGPIAFARYANTVYWQDRVRFIVQRTADMAHHTYNAWQHY